MKTIYGVTWYGIDEHEPEIRTRTVCRESPKFWYWIGEDGQERRTHKDWGDNWSSRADNFDPYTDWTESYGTAQKMMRRILAGMPSPSF